MNRLAQATLFLPMEALLPLMLVTAGLLFILGLRALAMATIVAALLVIFSPVLVGAVEDLLSSMPAWISWLVLAGIALSLLRLCLELLIGRRAADLATADLTSRMLRGLLLLPFRLSGSVLRWLVRRRTR